VPKSRTVPSHRAEMAEYLKAKGRGIGYRKSASDYLFRRR
jgi:hypothetical protein